MCLNLKNQVKELEDQHATLANTQLEFDAHLMEVLQRIGVFFGDYYSIVCRLALHM